jgi:hypothetical protein
MWCRLGLVLVVGALAGCGGDDEESSSASNSRCGPATAALMTPLGSALQNDRDDLENGQVVKSRDHNDIYFVSAELDGPGLFDPGDVATWATTSPEGDAAIYSVDELAKDNSTWQDGTAIAGLSLDDDGARESRACVAETTSG